MCGICGVASFRGEPVSAEALTRGCDALRHRGPDHTGVWIEPTAGAVGLAATRLAILDPTPAGNQPMHDDSGRYHLVHNGEVYNFREIRRELMAAGAVFRTDSDTEVILTACARWGVEALNRFNGMWALCFYDSRELVGFLSRDRFGIKPVIYSVGSDRLTFASELRALGRLGRFDRGLNEHAVRHHLQFGYIAHPATIYRGARRLAPGHFLRFTDKGASQPVAYYDPLARGPTSDDGENRDVREKLVRRISEAVTMRRVSDVPIGAFLSGGLDSAIVTYHLSAASPGPIKTFCVGYEGQKAFDERRYARAAAEHFGTDHHEVLVSEREALEALPRILDHLGEPFGDSSILPTSLLSEFARRHVTVALSGDGGDELFGGYWRYLGHGSLSAYGRIPRLVRKSFVEPAISVLSASKAGVVANRVRQFRKLLRADGGDALARHVAWSRILAPEAESIFKDPSWTGALDADIVESARRLSQALPDDDPLNRVLAFDLQYQLPADMLHKVDMAGMMHSLEVRVPLLDFHVVELALSLPSHWKVDRGLRKRILVDAYRGRIPDQVLDRPKHGFEVPIGEFFRGPLRPMFDDIVTRAAVESFGTLSYDGVQRVFADHLAWRADHADLLWALLSLCWWRGRIANSE